MDINEIRSRAFTFSIGENFVPENMFFLTISEISSEFVGGTDTLL